MRLIGRLRDETQARRFGDYLYAKHIESQIDEGTDGWEIWVLDEDQIDTATALFEQLGDHLDDPEFLRIAQEAAKHRHRDVKTKVPRRHRVVDARAMFALPAASYGVVTVVLIGISVAVALLTKLGDNDRFVQPLSIAQYKFQDHAPKYDGHLPEIRHGQIWRLFTPIFLHFNFLHILFNMLWLRDLGSMIEARKGSWFLFILVLVIAAISNVAQYYHKGPAFGGMSGVVYGLLGYVWMQGRFNPSSGLALHPQTVTMMIVWFFLCLSNLMGPIANTVHAAGLGVGIAWGYLAARRARLTK